VRNSLSLHGHGPDCAARTAAHARAEVVLPPSRPRETIELGARLAPEMMCVPFKMTLGNMVRCLEAGADVLAYVTGSWSCSLRLLRSTSGTDPA